MGAGHQDNRYKKHKKWSWQMLKNEIPVKNPMSPGSKIFNQGA